MPPYKTIVWADERQEEERIKAEQKRARKEERQRAKEKEQCVEKACGIVKRAKSGKPSGDKHPERIILFSAHHRYSLAGSDLHRSKFPVAGTVGLAQYFSLPEWDLIGRFPTVHSEAVEFLKALPLDQHYVLKYVNVLRNSSDEYAEEFYGEIGDVLRPSRGPTSNLGGPSASPSSTFQDLDGVQAIITRKDLQLETTSTECNDPTSRRKAVMLCSEPEVTRVTSLAKPETLVAPSPSAPFASISRTLRPREQSPAVAELLSQGMLTDGALQAQGDANECPVVLASGERPVAGVIHANASKPLARQIVPTRTSSPPLPQPPHRWEPSGGAATKRSGGSGGAATNRSGGSGGSQAKRLRLIEAAGPDGQCQQVTMRDYQINSTSIMQQVQVQTEDLQQALEILKQRSPSLAAREFSSQQNTTKASHRHPNLQRKSEGQALDHGMADSLDVARLDILSAEGLAATSHTNLLLGRAASSLSKPVPFLRLHESERRLYQYFITEYCKARTLYSDTRHNSFLQAIPSSPPREFMAAIFCLVSLYVGGAEMYYFNEVITFLRGIVLDSLSESRACLVVSIIRLLVQYHSVKRELDRTWVFHIKGFSALQSRIQMHAKARSLSIPIAYESIVKFVPTLQDGDLPNDGISIDYLLALDDPREIRDCGCSPELLHLLGCINEVGYRERQSSRCRRRAAQSLLARCDTIIQSTPEQHEVRRACIEKTAESYLHMTRVIIYWRLIESCDTVLSSAGNSLARCVLGIPVQDEWFTAQYPLAPAFWAMIFSPACGQQCYDMLASIWTDRPTNITHALRVANLIRERSQSRAVDVSMFKSVMASLQMDELSLG